MTVPQLVQTRQDLLRMCPDAHDGVIAELGVFAGDFAADILAICTPVELHLVDLWEGRIMCGDQDGRNITWREGEALYAEVCDRFAALTSVRVHRKPTHFLRHLPHTFDLVYIDADHSEASVYDDLCTAQMVIVPGGIIAGHDYTPAFPGVERAVTSFCRTYGWELYLLTLDGCPSYALRQR